jgi:hypothetical protein
MRDDMFKVIVERPRRGGWMDAGTARAYRNSEDAPAKIGIKKGYTHRKWLNENLAPLKRWLESQVNRPWDKVYAELCANIDRRSTVQEHIFAHIDQFVERETRLLDGHVYVLSRWSRELQRIEVSRATLYVHPATGILRHNKRRETWRQVREKQRTKIEAETNAKRRILNDFEQHHKIDGVWYHVTLATMEPGRPYHDSKSGLTEFAYPKHWDVVRKEMVSRSRDGKPTGDTLFGKRYVYASVKRQLSNAELKRYQLSNDTNDNAGNSRRFYFECHILIALTPNSVVPISMSVTTHFCLKRQAVSGVCLFIPTRESSPTAANPLLFACPIIRPVRRPLRRRPRQ